MHCGIILFTRYNISGEEFAPYFSLGNCMEGINIVLRSLYDVSLQALEPQDGELWSDDVYKLVHNAYTEESFRVCGGLNFMNNYILNELWHLIY